MSQLDLACDAHISARQLSDIEHGRVMPDPVALLGLAECLGVPLPVRNQMLSAAGHPPAYGRQDLDSPAMAFARRGIEQVLSAHDPHPALAIDRHWVIVSANKAVAHLVAGAEPLLLQPPVNLVRLCLHPAGLASRILNLPQWRAHVAGRLRREIERSGDPVLVDLLEEMRDYPGPLESNPVVNPLADAIALPFRLETIDGTISFFCTTTRFVAPLDITLSEVAIEAFLPGDSKTVEVMRRRSEQPGEGGAIKPATRQQAMAFVA
jgi:transcriptional regulator with XRE-family HTH domain